MAARNSFKRRSLALTGVLLSVGARGSAGGDGDLVADADGKALHAGVQYSRESLLYAGRGRCGSGGDQ
jgi:hypothetical protein